MALRIKKEIREALEAARKGDTVDLTKIIVPRLSGGKLVKATAAPSAELVRSFFLSDKTVDRDRDSIDANGWNLSEYQKNGAVLWAHDNWQPPVAEPMNTRVEGSGEEAKLYSDARFVESYDFSKLLLNLIDEGVLKNVSVGFIPEEWSINEERQGIDFKKQKLVEWSVVPVGSHPGAMVEMAKAKHLDLSPLRNWTERWLDGEKSLSNAVADEEEIAVLHKALSSSTPRRRRSLKLRVRAGEDESLVIEEAGATEEKGAISYAAAHSGGTPKSPESEKWDAPAEIAAATIGDLKIMSAWVDSENSEDKGAYKLPHHKAAGHSLVWNGVRAAMGALLGARGGVQIPEDDRKGVYNHLAKHYGEFDKTPPEFKANYSEDEIAEILAEPETKDGATCPGADAAGAHCSGCPQAPKSSNMDPVDLALAQLDALEETLIGDEHAESRALLAQMRAKLEPQEIDEDTIRTMVREALVEMLKADAEEEAEPIEADEVVRIVREAVDGLKEEILREAGRLPA